MIIKKYFFIISIVFLFTQCSKTPIDVSECDSIKTTSTEYLSCLNKVYASTNTAKNLKELKKHKTLKSFFKQVEVIQSD